MSWEPLPPKPLPELNASTEAARALLEAHDIDFDTRSISGPAVMLHWNGQTFTDLFGVDFVSMAGRAVLSLRKTGRRYREEAPPGTRISLGDIGRKGVDR